MQFTALWLIYSIFSQFSLFSYRRWQRNPSPNQAWSGLLVGTYISETAHRTAELEGQRQSGVSVFDLIRSHVVPL